MIGAVYIAGAVGAVGQLHHAADEQRAAFPGGQRPHIHRKGGFHFVQEMMGGRFPLPFHIVQHHLPHGKAVFVAQGKKLLRGGRAKILRAVSIGPKAQHHLGKAFPGAVLQVNFFGDGKGVVFGIQFQGDGIIIHFFGCCQEGRGGPGGIPFSGQQKQKKPKGCQ